MNSLKSLSLLAILFLSIILFSFCESGGHDWPLISFGETSPKKIFVGDSFKVNTRDIISQRLQQKIKNRKPLVIHAFVPLCDNEHQGIVPVNNNLGNGLNLKTNLYWGAGYGVKSYFKKYDNWKLISSKIDTVGNILERVIFNKKLSNGTSLYLIADGYRGDKMKECLHDYFQSIGGWKDEIDSIENQQLSLYSGADLLIFNGHDGLMDDTLKEYYSKDSIPRETVIVACYSKIFFNRKLEKCGGYPLIGTSGLLAPEAYVISAVINSWALQKSPLEIRYAAGDAYHSKHPKTSSAGARALFTTGW